MATDPAPQSRITVRYWAAARAAAGVESDSFAVDGPVSLADVMVLVRQSHADAPRLESVIGVCSALVGERPVGSLDPAAVMVPPGETVELLPPFAGG